MPGLKGRLEQLAAFHLTHLPAWSKIKNLYNSRPAFCCGIDFLTSFPAEILPRN